MGCCCIKNIQAVDDNDENLSESRVLMAYNKQALSLKQKGNEHFKKRAYLKAIECYLQALRKNPNQLVYHTNLAQAYRANGQFQEAIEVINKVQKKNFPPSANYLELMMKGNAIKFRCINSLAKKYIVSNTYSIEESQNWLKQINQAINLLEEAKKSSLIEVNQYLNNSFKIKAYLTKILKKTSESEVIHYFKRKIQQSKNGLHNQKGWQKVKEYTKNQQTLLQQLQNMYSKLHNKFLQQADEDQEYFVDPITYVLIDQIKQKYRDPVIVPSGISYQQKTLKDYFQKGQEYKDPITKQKFPIGEKVIVKNHALKNYINQLGKLHEIRKQDIQLIIC